MSTQLSPQAVAVVSQIRQIMQEADADGYQECYDAAQAVLRGVDDAFVKSELDVALKGLRPETPRQRVANAARILEAAGEYPLAVALSGDVPLRDEEVVALFEPAVVRNDIPAWVRGVINVRLMVAQTAIRKKSEPKTVDPVPEKPEPTAVDSTVVVRRRFEGYLEGMKGGRWCWGLARKDHEGLQNGDREAVVDLMEEIRATVEPCFERVRPKAAEQLENVGLKDAAEALYGDGADTTPLYDAQKLRNVPGWVKDVIGHRIFLLEKAERTAKQAKALADTDADVVAVADMVGRIVKIGTQVLTAPKLGPALLETADDLLDKAEGRKSRKDPKWIPIFVHLGLLEGLIDGQGNEDSFVSQKLRDDAALAEKVSAGERGGKARIFMRALLEPAREAVAVMRKGFGEVVEKPVAEPVALVRKPEHGKKFRKPALMQTHRDSPRRRREEYADSRS